MTKKTPVDPRQVLELRELTSQREHDQRIRDTINNLPYDPFAKIPTVRNPKELAALKAQHPQAIIYERITSRVERVPEIVVKTVERVVYKRTLNFPLVLNMQGSMGLTTVKTTYGNDLSKARGVNRLAGKGEYLTVSIEGRVGVKYPTYEGPEIINNAKIHLGLTTKQAQKLREELDKALAHNVKGLFEEAMGKGDK